jgi:hypothetical protein
MSPRLAQRNMHLPYPRQDTATTAPPPSRAPFARVQPATAAVLAGRGAAAAPDGLLRTWPVDRRVGSPRNNRPELLVELVTAAVRTPKPLPDITSEKTHCRKQRRPPAEPARPANGQADQEIA